MIKCPTCGARAPVEARYCTDCYTVFPSLSRGGKQFGAETMAGRTWKVPALVLLAGSAALFATMGSGFGMTGGAPGEVAGSRGMRLPDWSPSLSWLGTDPDESNPSYRISNARLLPCAPGALCQATMRFDDGRSASYLVSGSEEGPSEIWPADELGTMLLTSGRTATLAISKENSAEQQVRLAKVGPAEWAAIGGGQPQEPRAERGTRGEF